MPSSKHGVHISAGQYVCYHLRCTPSSTQLRHHVAANSGPVTILRSSFSILTVTKHISESNIEVVCVDLSIDISYMLTPYGLKDSGEAQKEKVTMKNSPDN